MVSGDRFILSEKPNALDGALEWLDAEIEKEEKENKLSRAVEEHIKPLVMKIVKDNDMTANK